MGGETDSQTGGGICTARASLRGGISEGADVGRKPRTHRECGRRGNRRKAGRRQTNRDTGCEIPGADEIRGDGSGNQDNLAEGYRRHANGCGGGRAVPPLAGNGSGTGPAASASGRTDAKSADEDSPGTARLLDRL